MVGAKVSQCERILNYIDEYGSITQMDALREFSCMRLASRVCDLRKAGYNIISITETSKNRYRENISYARYMKGE